jgi:hypothetical protein
VLDPTTPFWASLHLTPTQSFFALLWEQLCDGSTHDAWQLRAMGLPAVLLEIVEVCAASRTFPPLQHALGDLLDEAISLSHRDVVLKDHFRSATAVLEDKRLREGSSAALSHVELISLYLLDTLRPYPSLLKGELERLLATPSVREKQRLKLVAGAFGTELRAKGFSRLFLQSFAARLATSSFTEAAGELMSLLDLPATSFRCILPVKWPGFLDEVRLDQCAIHLRLPPIGDSPAERDFKAAASPGEQFFVIDVSAKDQFAAAQQAILITERILSLAVLYAPDRTIDIPRRAMLVRSGSTARLVELDLAHEAYVRGSGRSSENFHSASPRVTALLAGPLQYHSLGVRATAPESRLTNFWVALESLLVEQGGSIIGRVTECIAPSLALSYCGRLLRANAIQLVWHARRADRSGAKLTSALRDVLAEPYKKRFSVESCRLAQALLDEPRAAKLFSLCAGNPLLIFRLHQLREKLIAPGDLKASIEGHREHVCWQLARIYRARNSLVHRGALPIRSEHLIQHLHTYLAMTLHCLVREIGDSEILTVPAALARRRALYGLYLSKIRDRSLTFRNLLAEESCWVAPPDARIWPDVAAAG